MLLFLINVQQHTTVLPFVTAVVALLLAIISLINFLTDVGHVKTKLLAVYVCLS